MPQSPQSRPLDALAIAVTIGLCLTWGFNKVAIKLAIHDIPPLIQSAARSVVAAFCVGVDARLRGMPLFKRDGTLRAGIFAGVLFALEFLLIYRGLVWTTATRAVLFLYLAPFFVVIGSRWFIPGDHFYPSQWLGLSMSFVGIVIAFGLPTPAADPRQMLGDLMLVGAAAAWAATTLVIKASRAQPRQRREDHALPARRLGAAARRRGRCLRRAHRRRCRRRWRSAHSPIRPFGW